jgi:hypothetical protein
VINQIDTRINALEFDGRVRSHICAPLAGIAAYKVIQCSGKGFDTGGLRVLDRSDETDLKVALRDDQRCPATGHQKNA